MFSTLPKTNFNFSVAFNLSSANAFNLDQSKILLCGKELNHGHHQGLNEISKQMRRFNGLEHTSWSLNACIYHEISVSMLRIINKRAMMSLSLSHSSEPCGLCGRALKSRDLNYNPLVTSVSSSMI